MWSQRHATVAMVVMVVMVAMAACGALAAEESIENRIYATMTGYPCVRLLHTHGVIGCGYPMGSMHGPLLLVDSEADHASLLAGDYPSGKYVVVLAPTYFTDETLDYLEAGKMVEGVIVTAGEEPTLGFSPAVTCPTGDPDSAACVEWNPLGNGLSMRAFGFPIWALDAEHSAYVVARARDNQQRGYDTFPRYAAELNSFMMATQDAGTCLRRGRCDPVGGASVWASLSGPVLAENAQDYVLLTAAMDTNAFFHDLARGADNDISGVVALLGAATALAEATQTHADALDKQILVASFTGEAWGNYGSGRFVQDIQRKPFPCNKGSGAGCRWPYQWSMDFEQVELGRISAVIDMRQVGKPPLEKPNTVFAHIEASSAASSAFRDDLVALADTAATGVLIGTGAPPGGSVPVGVSSLPPSSIAPFLDASPGLRAVVLAEHETEYTSKVYNSRFDQATHVSAPYVCAVAEFAARATFAAASPDFTYPPSLSVNCTLVAELLACLTEDFECALVESVIPDAGEKQPSYYSSIFRRGYVTPLEKFIKDYLALLSQRTTTSDDGHETTESYSFYHPAYSTGIQQADKYGSYEIIDPTQKNWVEATWGVLDVRVFLQDNPVYEGLVLGLGILVAGLSFAIAWAVRRYLAKAKIL